MATVTDIRRTKRGRYSIYLDGAFYCALHPEVFALSELKTGDVADPETVEELRLRSEKRAAAERALRLLAGRSYTRRGLTDKLRERHGEEAAETAAARMEELGLLNDEDYARRCASDCLNLKGYSHQRTVQELVRKGIDRELAEAVLEEREEDPQEAIARIVERKYLRPLREGGEKGRNRTVNALLRLGYQYGDIRAALSRLLEDDYYSE